MKDHLAWDPPVAVPSLIALSMAMAAIVTTSPGVASACGPTPSVAHPLLPVEGATAVPINAVLIASSSYQRVTFTLREADSGLSVPVSVACETPDGAVAQLCLGRPGGLQPNTSYIWTALAEPPPGASPKPGGAEGQAPERTFTTGVTADLKAALSDLTPSSSPLLTVEVLEHETTAAPPLCGSVHSTRLRLSITQLRETVVLLGAGMGGLQRYAEPAPLLTAQSPSLALVFDAAPGPLAVRLMDGAGNVRHLPPWSPPMAFGAGCSAAPDVPSPGAAVVLVFALLLLGLPCLGASRRRPLLTILGLVAGGTGVLWALPGRVAACGPTPSQAFPLSPPAAATDVPLNAVLIASSTYPRVSFTLREATTGKAVPVSVACQLESDAQLCQAHPGPLLPNTAYRWSVAPEAPASQETFPVPPEQTFTTGDRVDTQAAFSNPLPGSAPLFTVDILQNQKANPSVCGVTHNVRLRFAFPGLDEPVVLAGAGMGGLPQFHDQPSPQLGPGAGSTERRFFGEPSCLALRLIDMAGNVRHFDPWCPPADQAPGCAAAPGRASGPGGLLVLVLLLGLGLGLGLRTRLRKVMALVLFSMLAACDDNQDPRTVDAGPTDGGAADMVNDAIASDAETGPAACACSKAGGFITTSFDCYCTAARPCGGDTDLTAALARVETQPPARCHQVREHAACGLTVIGTLDGYNLDYSLRIYDVTTGKLVGLSVTSDTAVNCPFGGTLQGSRLLVGRQPESTCAQSSCRQRCIGGASAWGACTP
jgi:hypothetical protein